LPASSLSKREDIIAKSGRCQSGPYHVRCGWGNRERRASFGPNSFHSVSPISRRNRRCQAARRFRQQTSRARARTIIARKFGVLPPTTVAPKAYFRRSIREFDVKSGVSNAAASIDGPINRSTAHGAPSTDGAADASALDRAAGMDVAPDLAAGD
jgi:hypothetical protein